MRAQPLRLGDLAQCVHHFEPSSWPTGRRGDRWQMLGCLAEIARRADQGGSLHGPAPVAVERMDEELSARPRPDPGEVRHDQVLAQVGDGQGFRQAARTVISAVYLKFLTALVTAPFPSPSLKSSTYRYRRSLAPVLIMIFSRADRCISE